MMNQIFSEVTHADAGRVFDDLGQLNNRFESKNLLITGAAGFLGMNFMRYFYYLNNSLSNSKKVNVYCLDSFLRESTSEFGNFFKSEHFKLIKRSIVDGIDDLNIKFDFIIHAATVASPIFYRKWPIETMDANVIGLRRILDWSLTNHPESILFFSSSEIYGDPAKEFIPTDESYNGNVSCTGPRACYDESKRYGETLCVNFWNVYNVPIKIARPFNNYGPGLPLLDGRVIPDFFNSIILNKEITLLSNGHATRTFCYISDAINGYLRLLLSSHNGQAFNIGTESPEICMSDLAFLCREIANSDVKVVYRSSEDKEYVTDNPNRRCPNIAKAKSLLAYAPKVDLRDGLLMYYNHYKLMS